MAIVEADVLAALRSVAFPGFRRDIVSLGVVRNVRVTADRVELDLVLAATVPGLADRVEADARRAVSVVQGVRDVRIRRGGTAAQSPALPVLGAPTPPSVAAAGGVAPDLLPGVRATIAVAIRQGRRGQVDGRGRTWRSRWPRRGLRIGLLDADIYGPSIPAA